MRKLFATLMVAGILAVPATANANERFWTGAALGAGAGAIIAGPVGAVVGGAAGALIGGPPITPLGFRHHHYSDRECFDRAGRPVACPPVRR